VKDVLGFSGKAVVVTGAASGMGAAAARFLAEVGAEVHALDLAEVSAPVKQSIEVDLADPASIDAAVPKLPDGLFAHFNCAGVPGPPRFDALQTMLVNFVGLRHLTEAVLPKLADGGSVASITSVAGMGWRKNLEAVRALCDITDFGAARDWCAANPDKANGYLFSKQCIIYYTKQLAVRMVDRDIRANCLSPAPTETAMLPDFHAQVSKEFMDEHFQALCGRDAKPEEMAEPLVFLGSRMARFVSGHNLFVDYAYEAAVDTGAKASLL